MSYSLLIRNLRDVFGENDPRADARPSLKVIDGHRSSPGGLHAFAYSSESLGHRGEVGAHNLPLPAFLNEDWGRSAMDGPRLAVLRYSSKHVVRIYDAYGIAVQSARWLSAAEALQDNGRDGLVEILAEERLAA